MKKYAQLHNKEVFEPIKKQNSNGKLKIKALHFRNFYSFHGVMLNITSRK